MTSRTAATTTTTSADDAAPRATRRRPATRRGVRLVEIGVRTALYVTQAPGDLDLYVVEKTGRIIRVEGGAGRPVGASRSSTSGARCRREASRGCSRSPLLRPIGALLRRLHRHRGRHPDPGVPPRPGRPRPRRPGDPPRAAAHRSAVRQPQRGLLLFGPDELMYVGTGDGGPAGDPMRNGQDLSTLLGKILRIDPTPPGAAYRIPSSNPFVDEPGTRGSTRTACATRGGSRSTASRTRSRSETWARTRSRRSTWWDADGPRRQLRLVGVRGRRGLQRGPGGRGRSRCSPTR